MGSDVRCNIIFNHKIAAKLYGNYPKNMFFFGYENLDILRTIIIIIIIIIIAFSYHRHFLPGTSLEPAVIPTVPASSFTLQYFPYYV